MNTPPHEPPVGIATRIARWLLLPYVLGVLFTAFGQLLLAGYGLAHASESAAGAFLRLLLIVGGVAIALPLSVLSNSRALPWRIARAFGLVAMALFSIPIGQTVWRLVIEPRLMIRQFDALMANVVQQPEVTETPLRLGGQLAGVRVTVTLRLAAATPASVPGASVLELLESLQLAPVEAGAGSMGMDPIPYRPRITIDGRPFAAPPPPSDPSAPPAMLPAGLYRIEKSFWFTGVSRIPDDPQNGLCREESLDGEAWRRQAVDSIGGARQPVIGTRLALKYRLGYRNFIRRWPAIGFRGDPAAWRAAFAQLPLSTCAAAKQQLEAARQRQQVEEGERRFLAGQRSIADEFNPLYLAMCAGDLEKTARYLGDGMPRFPLASRIVSCPVQRRDLAMLVLTTRALHLRTDEPDGYCQVLRALYFHQDADALQRLADERLPLRCESGRGDEWLAAFVRRDANGELNQPKWNEDTHRWLEFLVRSKVPVCAPNMEGSVLAAAMLEAPAKTLRLLLEAGCAQDRRGFAAPALLATPTGSRRATAAQLWPVRRFLQGTAGVAPLSGPEIATLDRLFQPPDGDELIGINERGTTFWYDLRQLLVRSAPLLHYSLQHQGDLALTGGTPCRSWYDPGYEATDPAAATLPEKALLDTLSNEQLARLIQPYNCTNDSVRPMTELQNFAPNGLGTYLCGRGVGACPAESAR
ncbi:MAG: hypothetical protein U1F11_10410 [Steroidobacteraceae bacterium]